MSSTFLNIAVFGSGKGSNFRTILEAIESGRIPNARIRVVISNNSTAGILEIARSAALPAVHLSRKQVEHESGFVEATVGLLQQFDVNFLVLAGYMKRLHPRIIATYRNRILNIHPALLPAHGGKGMYGTRVHEAVIAAGDRFSGATVHLVDEEYDHGPIVLQQRVEVSVSDTPESLAAKVLTVEHGLYPEAIRLFAEGRVDIRNGSIHILQP